MRAVRYLENLWSSGISYVPDRIWRVPPSWKGWVKKEIVNRMQPRAYQRRKRNEYEE